MRYLFLVFITVFNVFAVEATQVQVDGINSLLLSKQTDSAHNCKPKTIVFESSAMCVSYGSINQQLPSGTKISIDRNKEAVKMISDTTTVFTNKKLFFPNPLSSNINLDGTIFNVQEREEITLEAYVRYLKQNYEPGTIKAVYVAPTVNGNRYVPAKILFGQVQTK